MRLSEVIDDLYDRVLACQDAMNEVPTDDYEEEGFPVDFVPEDFDEEDFQEDEE